VCFLAKPLVKHSKKRPAAGEHDAVARVRTDAKTTADNRWLHERERARELTHADTCSRREIPVGATVPVRR
jgi:hypothetical protein